MSEIPIESNWSVSFSMVWYCSCGCLSPFKRLGFFFVAPEGMGIKKAWCRACCPFPRSEAFALPVLVETKQRRGPRKICKYAQCVAPHKWGYDPLRIDLHIQHGIYRCSCSDKGVLEVAKFRIVRIEASSKRFFKMSRWGDNTLSMAKIRINFLMMKQIPGFFLKRASALLMQRLGFVATRPSFPPFTPFIQSGFARRLKGWRVEWLIPFCRALPEGWMGCLGGNKKRLLYLCHEIQPY